MVRLFDGWDNQIEHGWIPISVIMTTSTYMNSEHFQLFGVVSATMRTFRDKFEAGQDSLCARYRIAGVAVKLVNLRTAVRSWDKSIEVILSWSHRCHGILMVPHPRRGSCK
jgi:hypothetical protein